MHNVLQTAWRPCMYEVHRIQAVLRNGIASLVHMGRGSSHDAAKQRCAV